MLGLVDYGVNRKSLARVIMGFLVSNATLGHLGFPREAWSG